MPTAALLAVASLLSGCALGPGDLGRPKRTLPEIAIIDRDPSATLAERERDDRLWAFRRAPEALPSHSSSARFNALTDSIGQDRALLAPLAAALRASGDKQRIRAGALNGLAGLDGETRLAAQERIDRHDAILAELCPLLTRRLVLYRSALERQVALAPEHEAVAAERALIALEREIGAFCPEFGPAQAMRPPPETGGQAPLVIKR